MNCSLSDQRSCREEWSISCRLAFSIFTKHPTGIRITILHPWQIYPSVWIYLYVFLCDGLACLDFKAPQIPFSIKLGKNISDNLKSCYSICLPNQHHVSFLSSSVPIQVLERTDIWEPMRRLSAHSFPGPVHENSSKLWVKHHLLYGRLFVNRMESLWAYRFHPDALSLASIVNFHSNPALSQVR